MATTARTIYNMKPMSATHKRLALALAGWLMAVAAMAQMMAPVSVEVSRRQSSPTELSLVFKATIDGGWHVYSVGLPAGGPTPASIHHDALEGLAPVGTLQAEGKEISTFDRLFGMTVRYFESSATFTQRYRITAPQYRVAGYLEYGACNEESCLPPEQVAFDERGTANIESPANEEQTTAPAPAKDSLNAAPDSAVQGLALADSASLVADTAALATEASPLNGDWAPVIDELQRFDGAGGPRRSLLYVLLMGFLGGLAALFTPCVWPMVPLTVGFFLRRAKNDRRRGIRDAVVYGLSIIAIYLALGLLVTAIFGASALNALSTNVWLNLCFFLLLAVFGLSMIGLFELRLPSSWSNAADNKASEAGGALSLFFMAATLVLVSFSCTAPIVGFLLVETASRGSLAAPVAGMSGFALALALPFTLFALFPRWLQRAPRSGSWMTAIKVALGFIELAFALKFLSVADMASGHQWLSRDLFLLLWIVIFLLLGIYLLRFAHKARKANAATGEAPLGRRARGIMAVAGAASLLLAAYMVPGLWGAPCKLVSAFTPPIYTQRINLYKAEQVNAPFTDYDEAMAEARRTGRPVLIDFTGYGCVNCRKMEAAVWTDAEVRRLLTSEFVLVSLYTDDKRPLDQPFDVEENGRRRSLRTVGDKWSYLQRHKFGANAQPFYVAVSPQGHPLAGSYGYDESVADYLAFLRQALDNR